MQKEGAKQLGETEFFLQNSVSVVRVLNMNQRHYFKITIFRVAE